VHSEIPVALRNRHGHDVLASTPILSSPLGVRIPWGSVEQVTMRHHLHPGDLRFVALPVPG
jgi:hypothetical protein